MLSNLKADFEKQHVLFKASVDKEDVLKMNTLKMDLKTDLIKLQSIQNMVNIIIKFIIYSRWNRISDFSHFLVYYPYLA